MGSATVPVATAVSFTSSYDIAITSLEILLSDLVQGPPCPLAVVFGRLADEVARVRTLGTESATFRVHFNYLESEALEWWRVYRDLVSAKRPR